MRRKKMSLRTCAAGMLACFLILVPTGCREEEEEPVTTETTYEAFEESVASAKTVAVAEDGTEVPVQVTFWYNDAVMTPYYEAAAVDFHDRYGIEILCTYVDNVNYLEQINQANIDGRGPDLFIASNDEVRKAHMAGLTRCNALYTEEFWTGHYPAVAKSAMTSDGKQYGYPIYLDTTVMIYDTAITVQPESFGSITEFAISFEDETNTKDIFRWNISDPFYDYLFLGNGAQVFGDSGEDTGLFNVNNESVIQSMTYYQSLHDYFSIDVDSSSYEKIKSELTDGTLVYGIVKTDVLSELSGYGSSYALCPVPPLSEELPVKNLSVTYGAFVSEFTRQPEYANLFAAYLSYEYAGNLFGLSQRTAVRSTLERTDANEAIIYRQYCNTNPVPKALENGDFWIYTEICFKNIWNGSDVAAELSKLQEKMLERLK